MKEFAASLGSDPEFRFGRVDTISRASPARLLDHRYHVDGEAMIFPIR
jgi:hypothetical protein